MPDDKELEFHQRRQRSRLIELPPVPNYQDDAWLPSVENLIQLCLATFGERFAHITVLGRWHIYENGVWHYDECKRLENEIASICIEVAAVKKAKTRMRLENGAIVFTIEKRLRGVLAAQIDLWDRDSMLLNCAYGSVELNGDGSERAPRALDYCTRACAVSPSAMDCPIWHQHIEFVTNGDKELALYLQRAVGYTLTGSTKEETLFFLYGTGANGKSVFVNTIHGVLGSYAQAAATSTFTRNRYEQHPEELAVLNGARMVIASETEAGHAWTEARIKMVTGGDMIRAHFMRQDSFEFPAKFKLWIMGNRKPFLFSTDPAIRRRFHIVPFMAQVSEVKRDKDLREKLRAEWPGILQWAIEGVKMWREQGLNPPDAVRNATLEYYNNEDVIGAWIEDCLDRLPTAWISSSGLYASWKKYAESIGEFPGSMKRLSQELTVHGIKIEHTRKGSGVAGLAIRPTQEQKEHEQRRYGETADLLGEAEAYNGYSAFQIVGPEPDGVCEQCGASGSLYLIRDPFQGVASHVLHEGCAAKFYGR